MKTLRSFFSDARRHKGLALIIVLSMLALTTIVMLAFLSVADTEHKGTMTYSSSQGARRLADTAVNLVISQIRAGSEHDDSMGGARSPASWQFHSTQPGSVRKYNESGAFLAGYKLFSDASMIYTGRGSSNANTSVEDEYNFVKESEPPDNWNQGNNAVRYVDLNEPVIKGVAAVDGTVNSAQTYFPILDPRAAYDMDPAGGAPYPAEGFQYSNFTGLTGKNIGKDNDAGDSPIVLPPATGSGPDSLRLAMPVQWLYMLKDGTLGTLGTSGGSASDAPIFQSSGGTQPSAKNPIIARVAFWADDESCKLNINTASEPTFQGKPTYYHERDHRWADYSAARGEYQRFPGHPATVALSSVLFPNSTLDINRDLETYGKTPGSGALKRALGVKNRIYDLIPRLNSGGSNAGTQLFAADDYSGRSGGLTKDVDLSAALNERIYATVDELFFSELSSGKGRQFNDTTLEGGGNLFNKQTLERASGFLTAHSRASEISMLGLPRIAMWPVHTDANRRTGFDNLIRFCSRIGPMGSDNLYIFQRQDSRSPTTDVKLPRNKLLLEMLDNVLSTVRFPSETATGGVGATYKTKMGRKASFENYRQVIVEMFDYIRSTNLYDSFLAEPQRNNWPTFVSTAYSEQSFNKRDQLLATNKPYTSPIARNPSASNNPFNDRALPGHGQVTPAVWNMGGQNYRGFGRSVSISEIGLHFICTADGQPDMYSWRIPNFEKEEAGRKQYSIPHFDLPTDIAKMDALEAATYSEDNPTGIISGGRTALALQSNITDYIVDHAPPRGFGGSYDFINATGENWTDKGITELKKRYYSNYPPSPSAGRYGTDAGATGDAGYGKRPDNHPGYDPNNWNYTLDPDTPLKPMEKRVQAMIHFEFFCPSVGYTTIFPEFTLVLDGEQLPGLEVLTTNGMKSIFSRSEDVVLKSAQPIYEIDGSPQVGGYASFRRIARSRNLPGSGAMPADAAYDSSASGNIHGGMANLDLVSDFFTVTSDQPMQFQYNGRPMRVRIYNTHDYQKVEPVQTIYFTIPPGQAPTPDLVVQSTHYEKWIRQSDGLEFEHPDLPAPHWWAFHRGGALGRPNILVPGRLQSIAPLRNLDGDTAKTDDPNRPEGTRQRFPGTTALIYGFDNTGNYSHALRHDNLKDPKEVRLSRIQYQPDFDDRPNNRLRNHVGSDVVRALQPGHGDARLIFAKTEVKETEWSPHVLWNSAIAFIAHNFSSYRAGSEPGFDRSGDAVKQIQKQDDPLKRALSQSILVSDSLTPDAPFSGLSSDNTANTTTQSLNPAYLAQRYFDFDDSDPGGRVGTFINKADEGNFSVGEFQGSGWPKPVEWRSSYFSSSSFGARFAPGARSFFTPNRVISSPLLMGSLPSRVHFQNTTGPDAATGGNGAWTNLLFRPHLQLSGGLLRHPGQVTPPDHYLLDLFWMPVVEPYAISEPLSTAGKVNMNYQMIPFTHIRRATALHAVMKGEVFAALPNVDHNRARSTRQDFGRFGSTAPLFQNEAIGAGQRAAKWHRNIVIDRLNKESGTADQLWWNYKTANQKVVGTLRQFEERFNFGANEVQNGVSGVGGSRFNDGLQPNFRSGLFRSASQICELHLIPSRISVSGNSINSGIVAGADKDANENVRPEGLDGFADRNDSMKNFWNNHAATGDNTREAPYSNLYAKLTTRSNTFRVHVRAQMVKKALRGSNLASFVPGEDEISGEFRGSFLVERYIDVNDIKDAGEKADFAKQGDNPMDVNKHPPLDSYYRFRVLESKRFSP
jgi:uncharacterized protein (TIGR02600 family)